MYNIYITNGEKAVGQIGEKIAKHQVERRIMTGLSRIDTDNYFIDDVKVGSKEDLKYLDDLK